MKPSTITPKTINIKSFHNIALYRAITKGLEDSKAEKTKHVSEIRKKYGFQT